jgi:hypothetical protein
MKKITYQIDRAMSASVDIAVFMDGEEKIERVIGYKMIDGVLTAYITYNGEKYRLYGNSLVRIDG